MPPDPVYDEHVADSDSYRAHLYSAEYQTYYGPDRLKDVNDHTPLCAVCQAHSNRSSVLMIPAKNSCPSNWHLEYKVGRKTLLNYTIHSTVMSQYSK